MNRPAPYLYEQRERYDRIMEERWQRDVGLDRALFQTPRRDFSGLIFRRRLPIVITLWEFYRWDADIWRLEIRFRHPCPCEGWKLDREFLFRMEMPSIHVKIRPFKVIWRDAKQNLRIEAYKHVMEFMIHGTQDGK